MKSKASYFSLSMPLIRENLRRFWAVPALAFLVYFLSGIFPILMSYSDINNMAVYIRSTLNNQQPFFCIVHLAVPIIAAMVTLKFMQQSSSVTYMHGLPLSRSRIFNSSLISGWLMCLLPLLATGLILLLLATPTFELSYFDGAGNEVYGGVDVFTRPEILSWLWQSFIVVTFIYAVSVFAGMVTGNSALQTLLSVVFCFLLPSLWLAFDTYCGLYLWGYKESDYNILLQMFPWLEMLRGESFSNTLTIIYLLAIVVLFAVSAVLAQRRKLEKAGDGVVFGFMVPVLCYLITFLGMSLFGFYFYMTGDFSFAYMYVGMAAGTLITFIIARMLVLKTPRIFNTQSLKSLAVYALAAVIFTCGLTFDFTGFEDRVPDPTAVTSASMDILNQDSYSDGSRYDDSCFAGGSFKFKDPENIELVTKYHRSIVESKADIQAEDALDSVFFTRYVQSIQYFKGDKVSSGRKYQLSSKFTLGSEYAAKLYESEEFKDYYSFDNIKYGTPKNITVYSSIMPIETAEDYMITINKTDFKEFTEALEKDFRDRTYDEYLETTLPYASVEFGYPSANVSFSFGILRSDANTIKWLEDHGYSEILTSGADTVTKAEISLGGYDLNSGEYSSFVVKTITDKDQIAEILRTGEATLSTDPSANKWYTVHLSGVTSYRTQTASDDYYDYEYDMAYTEDYSLNLYFTLDDAPDFIK